ncbi:MAG: prolyl oligopeptidase family serine peptidase [Lachnospiraceae bacterium]|nr:prolyl oligopeptidase family serine peptidase [Lachnospiraceae bacterium]
MERREFGKLQYVVKEPGKLAEKNPTIIFLHGAGSRGNDIGVLEQNPFFNDNSHISNENSPFMVFAPLCNRNSWFDMFEQLQDFVKIVADHPAVDANRLYLMGTSMGGYGSWQLAMTMPEYFAALVPVCGGGMRWNVKRLINVPVWAFHGKDDKTVPSEESVFMVEKLNEVGGNARLTLLDNTAHNSWDYAYAQRELFDWMLRQRNTNTPEVQDNEYADSKQFG